MAPPAAGEGGFREVYGLVSLLPAALLLLALPAAVLGAARLRPVLDRAAHRLAASPGGSLGAGATASILTLLLLAGSGTSSLVAVPAVLALGVLAVFAFLGLSAEARRLGGEIRGREPAPGGAEAGSTALGWLVLSGLPLLPVAGPLVLLYLALRGAGAAILGVAGR